MEKGRFSVARWRRWAAAGVLSVTLVTAGPASGGAQEPVITNPRDTAHTQSQAPFFTTRDAVLAALFAGGTVAMFPLDKHFALQLQKPGQQAFIRDASKGVENIASPGAYVIGAGLYVVGRAGKFDRVADLGLHGLEAVLLADGVTYVLKGIAGRERPFVSGGNSPHSFHFGKGFTSGDYASFPSGHTTSAFAAAAAVTNETRRWWPHSTIIIGPLMYGGATAVGLSRMYHNRHWASDVMMGAAIGTFSGRKMVQYTHGHRDNLIDRVLLHTAVAPDGRGGAMFSLSLPTP